MKKILILATNYPNNEGGRSLFYIHTRNKYYLKKGLKIEVLNFSTDKSYEFEGISVISRKDLKKKKEKYSIIISHAPNIRNHILFISRNLKEYNVLYFFHGHEVLETNKFYPKPYSFMHKQKFKFKLQKYYDRLKLIILKYFFKKHMDRFHFVFVSNFLRNIACESLKVSSSFFLDSYIIPNSVGEAFQKNNYIKDNYKKYDVVIIRNNFDSSTYCIDIVLENAINNPLLKYCIIGEGKYFNYYNLPQNVELISKSLSHEEIIDFLNLSKIALMPTRHDSQGVMSCEVATFGIPLLTSKLLVTKEVFDSFENVALHNNGEIPNLIISKDLINNLIKENKNKKFFNSNTVEKEVELIKKLKERSTYV